MVLKTKLLLSLCTLGVVGGTSTGVYYLKNKDVSDKQNTQAQPGSAGEVNADIRNTGGGTPLTDRVQASQTAGIVITQPSGTLPEAKTQTSGEPVS